MRWIDHLEGNAAGKLPEPVAEYFSQGATAGVTAGEAVSAWDVLRLRPRMLRDVSSVSTSTTVLGRQVETPILVAPSTLQRQAHPDGEAATTRATARAGALACVSTNAGTKFTALTGPWWVQAYVLRDRGLTAELLERAREGGAQAVVLTVDTPVVGTKYSTGASVWSLVPADHLLANVDRQGLPDEALDKAADLTPDVIGWLHEATGLPVVVKGVMRGDDARDFVAAGAAAVLVSNHGGRQLDRVVSTARALPEIVDALAGSGAEVYVDGGLRRGEHVLSALALGARAVFVGRPVLWALAVDGEDGVHRLLADLTTELRHAMALVGAADVASLTRDLVA